MRTFNTTGRCIPKNHYMVNIDDKLKKIRTMVEDGSYFVINRARQYGKTTTLRFLAENLNEDFIVISLDFQKMSNTKFKDEYTFATAFAGFFIKTIDNRIRPVTGLDSTIIEDMKEIIQKADVEFGLVELFYYLSDLCATAEKPVVLIIDEVDSAANNQVFLDFLAQLRAYYLDRDESPIFQSVILAGVYDIKNLKMKIRPESEHRYNSPWNIAETFDVDMSFSASGIAGMLNDYEGDHHTGMDVNDIAQCIYEYTAGYPFLVSLICKVIDRKVSTESEHLQGNSAWSVDGVKEAVKIILREQATIFESMVKQICTYHEIKDMLYAILFLGSRFAYNPDNFAVSFGTMFGYITNKNGYVAVANRIFEMRLYNFFLAEEQLTSEVYLEAQKDKNQFIRNGMLDMDRVIEKFVVYFSDVYGDNDQKFIESYGRKFFLLYLKPIINGTGNYYVEAETRDAKRTDVIVDYLGEQFIVELKIWNGEKYHADGETQVIGYLERHHLKKGYLLTFCFNKNKKPGVKKVQVGDKTIVEAIV